ncbi:tail fiber protein [Leptolyngbya phage LPP-1]|uniref:NAD(+)--protein-arginine ADP-ribosyltransferase n=1 Tax=Leptolyngbya phage LPP-1 TaxID=2996049 RepID=A0AAE9PXB3_9CAUD|nr:tail fiber protein [Leptolyngbya phage LPP-1]
MSDPIQKLRDEQKEFTAILDGASRKMPTKQSAAAVEAATQPASPPPPPTDLVPERTELPPAQLQTPIDASSIGEGWSLGGRITEAPAPPTPQIGVTPTEVLQGVVTPNVEQGLQSQLDQRAINDLEASQATQAVMPYIYQPPSLDAVQQSFGETARWSMQNIEQQNIQARANRDLQLQQQAEWSRQALEFLQSEEGKKGATGDPFDWVKDIVGVKENGRTYLQPWNDKRGFSVPASLLYGLGVVQNSGVGAILDVKALTQFVTRSAPPWAQVDPGRLPGWAQGLLNSADKALSQTLGGANAAIPALLSGDPRRGLFRGIADWLRTPDTRITDKKSNVIEAIRGAQYSFTDEVGTGVGIKVDRGIRVGAAPGKGFGFDVNPSVLVGFGLDVIAGNRADKIIDTGRILFSPVRGAYRMLRGKRSVEAVEQALANVPAPPSSPPVPFVPKQLELPFLPNMPQVVKKKPASEAKILEQTFSSQALAAFKKANQQQAKKIVQMKKAQAAAAAKTEQLSLDLQSVTPVRANQLELDLKVASRPLDDLPTVNVSGRRSRTPTPTKRVQVEPQQLELNFNAASDPVRAAQQVLENLPKTGNPAADAYMRGRVINSLLAEAKQTSESVQQGLDITPDIGRKFVGDAPPSPPAVNVRVGELPTVAVPDAPTFHGTRVEGLNLSVTDPVEGASRSELGTAHYLTTDPDQSRAASLAISSENLPDVEGRIINAPKVVNAQVEPSARLIDAKAPSPQITRIADAVGQEYGVRFSREPMTLIDMFDEASRQLPEVEALQFQRAVVKTLREAGYDGAVAGRTIAVYNPQVIRQTGEAIVDEAEGVIPKLAARADLEGQAVNETGAEFAKAASVDSEVRLASQVAYEAQRLADEVASESVQANELAKLWDDLELPDTNAQVLDFGDDVFETSTEVFYKAPMHDVNAYEYFDILSSTIYKIGDPTYSSSKIAAALDIAEHSPDLAESKAFKQALGDAIEKDMDYWETGGTMSEAEDDLVESVKKLFATIDDMPLDGYPMSTTMKDLGQQSFNQFGMMSEDWWTVVHYYMNSSNSDLANDLAYKLSAFAKSADPDLQNEFFNLVKLNISTINGFTPNKIMTENALLSVLTELKVGAAGDYVNAMGGDPQVAKMLADVETFAGALKTEQTILLNSLLNDFKYYYNLSPTNKSYWDDALGRLKDYWYDHKSLIQGFNAEYEVQKTIADNISVDSRRTIEALIRKYEPSFNPEPAFGSADEIRELIIKVKNPPPHVIERLNGFNRNELVIYAYTDTQTYDVVNQYLRTGVAATAEPYTSMLRLLPDLDVAIRTQPTASGTLYRGVGGLKFTDALEKYKLGEEVTETMFLSTSTKQSVAQSFGAGGTHFVILDAKGYKLHSVASKFLTGESEVLLPRNTKFAVEGIDESTRTITLRQIPNHEFTSYNRISVLYSELQELERQFYRNPDPSIFKAMAERQAELDELVKKSPCEL